MPTLHNPVEIKGQKEGLWIFLADDPEFPELLEALRQKLEASNNFFREAEVTIDTGNRECSNDEKEQLRMVVEDEYTLRVKEILHSDRQEEQAEQEEQSEEVQRNVSEIEGEQPVHHPEENVSDELETDDDEFMKFLDETFRIPVKRKWEEKETYSSDYLYENEESAFYFRGTIRSGQTLEFPGNIVVLGDINPGAYVIASGDIVVMGRLHGVVHAGAEGEERAVVISADFRPSQLRIAQYIGRPPDEYPRSRTKHLQTEKAYVRDGAIVIEPIL
ncbi:septum site-determining protein MinC [candidate division KSB3 bacterium]|uniref:Probable septum site-determining protein MinC n=1 Tax=candidate division KSB3 bacterium TaxID=2044937 RepID=A0A2G6KHG0_9BACT|nr:MAG: septum site-determining protein MinC [candidate division KSB3 bacterium]